MSSAFFCELANVSKQAEKLCEGARRHEKPLMRVLLKLDWRRVGRRQLNDRLCGLDNQAMAATQICNKIWNQHSHQIHFSRSIQRHAFESRDASSRILLFLNL